MNLSDAGKFTICLSLAFAAQLALAASTVARIVAVVNDEAILSVEVEKEMERVTNLTRLSGGQVPERDVLYDIVLARMVENKLQMQRIRELGIRVDERQVDETISRILARNGNIPLAQYLNEVGQDEEGLREEIRRDLLIDQAVIRDNEREIRIDSNDVDEQLRARLARPELREHMVEHAHFTVEDRDLAVTASTLSSAEFGDFAEHYSISEDPVNLGWRSDRRLPTAFSEQIEKLRPGGVSDVMELSNGLHVIHLIASRPAIPGHSQQGHVRLKMFKGGEETTEQEMSAAVDAVRAGQQGFEEAAESLGGLVWVVEEDIRDLPASVTGELRMISGEFGGPIEYEGQLVAALVLGVENEAVDDEELRRQASVLASDINYLEVRRKWVEYLRSIGTVEIVRANP